MWAFWPPLSLPTRAECVDFLTLAFHTSRTVRGKWLSLTILTDGFLPQQKECGSEEKGSSWKDHGHLTSCVASVPGTGFWRLSLVLVMKVEMVHKEFTWPLVRHSDCFSEMEAGGSRDHCQSLLQGVWSLLGLHKARPQNNKMQWTVDFLSLHNTEET